MSARPLPSYLRVVPPAGKRFRRPRKSLPPAPLVRHGDEVAALIRQAERVEAIVKRLHEAIIANDEIVARALIDRAEIEAGFQVLLSQGLRNGTLCASS